MIKKALRNYSNKKFISQIREILNGQNIKLTDVGAAGGLEPRWERIAELIDYIGFEPDNRSSNKLKEYLGDCANVKVVPSALWSDSIKLDINLCKKEQVSSHYEPNIDLLKRYPEVERFKIENSITLEAITLDDLHVDNIDFIKLDIQGGELNALKGGEKTLNNVFGVEVEVEFIELYRKQPLYGEVTQFLSKAGLEFIDFTNIARWERDRHRGLGQCVFGDALYLRTPEKVIGQLESKKLNLGDFERYLAILSIYGRVDLVKVCRDYIKEKAIDTKLLTVIDRYIQTQNNKMTKLYKYNTYMNKMLRLLDQNVRVHYMY